MHKKVHLYHVLHQKKIPPQILGEMSKKGQKTPKDARKTPKSIFPQLLRWNLFCGVRHDINELYYA